MMKSNAIRTLLCILPLLSLALLPMNAASLDDPEGVAERLKKNGLAMGENGVVDDINRMLKDGVAQDDWRWECIELRVQAVELAESLETVRKALARKPRGKDKLDDTKLLKELGAITVLMGKSGESFAERLNKLQGQPIDRKDVGFVELIDEIQKAGSRMADVRTRIAYINPESMEKAIKDLSATFPEEYKKGDKYLKDLPDFAQNLAETRDFLIAGDEKGLKEAEDIFEFQNDALLSNPLLEGDGIVMTKFNVEDRLPPWKTYGSSAQVAKSNGEFSIEVLEDIDPEEELEKIYQPSARIFLGHLELSFDAKKLMFTEHGRLMEMNIDGSGLRQIIKGQPDWLDNYDGCYLPDGSIIFSSTAGYKTVPCNDGKQWTQSFFRLNPDGSIRRLTFDQDHDWFPMVMNDGKIMYTRWDYTDAHHYYARLLMTMNPDGTSQFAAYGSNAYYPNGKQYSRQIPWNDEKVVTVEIGHVEPIGRVGSLMLLNLDKGSRSKHGVEQYIPEIEKPIRPHTNFLPIRDWSAPRYRDPWPLHDAHDPRGSGKYFLTSCRLNVASTQAIYLVDVFGNMTLVKEVPGYDLTDPIPLRERLKPPVIPERIRPEMETANVHLLDVYIGDGLKHVPRGKVKELRVFAYHFCYDGLGGHIPVAINGPWDARRILGTTPVYEDGSAYFQVPANTPVAVQPLDENGRALQVMRSWYTAMPGENTSCIGCHEDMSQAPINVADTIAMRKGAKPLDEWYGPARPFDFEREVQPVVDKYCISCHNKEGMEKNPLCYDLRSLEAGNKLGPDNIHEYYSEDPQYPNWHVKGFPLPTYFPPAYRVLQRYVRRYRMEGDYILRNPSEYHVGTSPLIQMLEKGHHGVQLDEEAWDRLVTWVDLNVPAHGTWTEMAAHKPDADKKVPHIQQQVEGRLEVDRMYGGQPYNPEVYPEGLNPMPNPPLERKPIKPGEKVTCDGWPMSADAAQKLQAAVSGESMTIALDDKNTIELKPIPAGSFPMGDHDGTADERPMSVVKVEKPFWIMTREITNAEYALFDPDHESGYFDNWGKNNGNRGKPMNEPEQPVIRVSYDEAQAFCKWLSEKSGKTVRLPTEAEWEYACRAGTDTDMYYGEAGADWSKYENFSDLAMLKTGFFFPVKPYAKHTTTMRYYSASMAIDNSFDDDQALPGGTAMYQPNAWGLHDMLGNVQEWTSSVYKPYPYNADDGREAADSREDRVVRGGAWSNVPRDVTAGRRLHYPPWQRVFNVGFRVVVEE